MRVLVQWEGTIAQPTRAINPECKVEQAAGRHWQRNNDFRRCRATLRYSYRASASQCTNHAGHMEPVHVCTDGYNVWARWAEVE